MIRFESVRRLDLATRALRRALAVAIEAAEDAGLDLPAGLVEAAPAVWSAG